MTSVRPSLPGSRLQELATHVVVGDYPEVLAVLRRRGVDLDHVGARRLSDFADRDLLAEIERAIAWRPAQQPPSGG